MDNNTSATAPAPADETLENGLSRSNNEWIAEHSAYPESRMQALMALVHADAAARRRQDAAR